MDGKVLDESKIGIIVYNLLHRLDKEYEGLKNHGSYVRLYCNLASKIYDAEQVVKRYPDIYKKHCAMWNGNIRSHNDKHPEDVKAYIDDAGKFEEDWVASCRIPVIEDMATMTKLLLQSLSKLGLGPVNGQHRVMSLIKVLGSYDESHNKGRGLQRKRFFNCTPSGIRIKDDVSLKGLNFNLDHFPRRVGRPTFNILICPATESFKLVGVQAASKISRLIEKSDNDKKVFNTQDLLTLQIASYVDICDKDEKSIERKTQEGYMFLKMRQISVSFTGWDIVAFNFPQVEGHDHGYIMDALTNYVSACVHTKRAEMESSVVKWAREAKDPKKKVKDETKKNKGTSQPMKKQKTNPVTKPDMTIYDACNHIALRKPQKDDDITLVFTKPSMEGFHLKNYVFGQADRFFDHPWRVVSMLKPQLEDSEQRVTLMPRTLDSFEHVKDQEPVSPFSVFQAHYLQSFLRFWGSLLENHWGRVGDLLKVNSTNNRTKNVFDQGILEPWMFSTLTGCVHSKQILMPIGNLPPNPQHKGPKSSDASYNRVPIVPRALVPVVGFIALLALDVEVLQRFGEVMPNSPGIDAAQTLSLPLLRLLAGIEDATKTIMGGDEKAVEGIRHVNQIVFADDASVKVSVPCVLVIIIHMLDLSSPHILSRSVRGNLLSSLCLLFSERTIIFLHSTSSIETPWNCLWCGLKSSIRQYSLEHHT